MSALGDYIHFHGSRYDKYGTNRNSGSFSAPNSSSYDSYVNQRIQEGAAKGLSQKDLDEIAETISTFMEESSSGGNQNEVSAIQNLLMKQFEKELVEGLNYATGKSSASTSNKVGKVSARQGDNGLYLTLEELVRKINRLEKAYLDSDKNIRALNTLKSEIAKAVNTSWPEIKSKTPEALKQFSIENPIQGSSMREIRKRLNEAINTYAKFPNIASLEGTAFEYIIAAALSDTANLSVDEIIDKIQKSNTGADIKYTSQYNKDNFASFVVSSGNSILDFKYNQRAKIDTKLQWHGEDLRFSAKSVSFDQNYKWIHLVSDTPLLYLIQDIDGTFMNHYINSISLKKSSSAKNVRETTSQTLKRYLFYKALTGDTNNSDIKDTANLLIVNDKTGKYKVRVYDIASLYKKASENLSKVSVKVNGGYLNKINLVKHNEWADSAEQRINNLIMQIHQLKVSVSFDAGSLLS